MDKITLPLSSTAKIAVVGLGYVGLPLAMAFTKKLNVLGFDVSMKRINDLKRGDDLTNEFSASELQHSNISFSSDPNDLSGADFYIISVPTPVDEDLVPDMSMLISASKLVGQHITEGGFVIYESTVYPGATEEVCLPVLEKCSGLKLNEDFFLGYSPERINPSDKIHTLDNIIKVVSGSNEYASQIVDALYSSIISAGTYLVSSIKVAEAAKVIENTQRDINIALMNEFAQIFSKLGLDTEDVLKAAETKWNFMSFRPGLVGGHCIGIDPYYLTYKSKQVGYNPEVILSGRKINDGMSKFISDVFLSELKKISNPLNQAKVLILGYSFKENCNDIRNTKVHDLALELKTKVKEVAVYDPVIDGFEASKVIDIDFINSPEYKYYDGIILAVAHNNFKELGVDSIRSFCRDGGIIYDLKHLLPADQVDLRL
jgi:UDP-N-acetyl-D-glucosamine/UDP-N-acetyl-D-galactosamine dehydrogenase